MISREANTALPAIESMVLEVMSRPEVQAALRNKGIALKEALDRLELALNSGMIRILLEDLCCPHGR